MAESKLYASRVVEIDKTSYHSKQVIKHNDSYSRQSDGEMGSVEDMIVQSEGYVLNVNCKSAIVLNVHIYL